MAVIHRATLTPTKLEAVLGWLPSQPWAPALDDAVVAGRFRFDDPADEVGVETLLVRTGDGTVLHVPLTYRASPLAGAEEFLVAGMDHSVLGRRWVYDATGDPVYADTLRRTIATGGREADVVTAVDGRFEPAAKEGFAQGSGSDADSPTVSEVRTSTGGAVTTVDTGHGRLLVLRVLGGEVPAGQTLTARWDSAGPTVVAVLAV